MAQQNFNGNDFQHMKDMMFDEETHSLKDYINIIRQRQISVMIISLVVLVLAIVYAATATDIYKANTILKISEPQGSILDASFLPEFGGR